MILNRRERHQAPFRAGRWTSLRVAPPLSGLGLRARCLPRCVAFLKPHEPPARTYAPSEQDFPFARERNRAPKFDLTVALPAQR
jgi:hypothetical protein